MARYGPPVHRGPAAEPRRSSRRAGSVCARSVRRPARCPARAPASRELAQRVHRRRATAAVRRRSPARGDDDTVRDRVGSSMWSVAEDDRALRSASRASSSEGRRHRLHGRVLSRCAGVGAAARREQYADVSPGRASTAGEQPVDAGGGDQVGPSGSASEDAASLATPTSGLARLRRAESCADSAARGLRSWLRRRTSSPRSRGRAGSCASAISMPPDIAGGGLGDGDGHGRRGDSGDRDTHRVHPDHPLRSARDRCRNGHHSPDPPGDDPFPTLSRSGRGRRRRRAAARGR